MLDRERTRGSSSQDHQVLGMVKLPKPEAMVVAEFVAHLADVDGETVPNNAESEFSDLDEAVLYHVSGLNQNFAKRWEKVI